MVTTLEGTCPGCGRSRRHEEPLCGLCGHLFADAPATPLEAPEATKDPRVPPPTPGEPVSEETARQLRAAGIFTLVGLLGAPLFLGLPFLARMHWFLAALVHEMGHTFSALLLGRPAFPTLSLSGHAATFSQERSLLLTGLVFTLLLAGALRLRRPLGPALALVVLVVHPLLVFHGSGELLFLVGGHLGELAFACLALHRALTGGFTHSRGERALYSIVGWAFLADNLRLTLGLLFRASARADYATGGSYGLTNDYLVVARDFSGGALTPAVLVMTLAALAVPPLAWWIARRFGTGD